jgi:hypothetical protein
VEPESLEDPSVVLVIQHSRNTSRMHQSSQKVSDHRIQWAKLDNNDSETKMNGATLQRLCNIFAKQKRSLRLPPAWAPPPGRVP